MASLLTRDIFTGFTESLFVLIVAISFGKLVMTLV